MSFPVMAAVPDSGEARLSPFTLSFSGPVESEFLEHYFDRCIRQVRTGFILGTLLYAGFGFLDLIVVPTHFRALWFIRFAIVCPVLLLAWALSFRPVFRRLIYPVVAFAVAIAGFGVIAMTMIAPSPANYLYSAGLMLVLMFGYTFVRLRFIYMLATGVILTAAYHIATISSGRTAIEILTNNDFFLVTTNILGGFAAYSIEALARRDYIQSQNLIRSNRELVESKQEVVASSERAQLIFSALADALPGTVLEGKYQLGEKIGSGAFGTVYRGRHLHLDCDVAVKVFRPVPGKNIQKGLERFRREGISAKRINHPNAVEVLDFGISASAIAFLVMELLEGHSLSDEIRDSKTLSARRCAEIALPVCSVLAEAHRLGIIHRDIKPSNVFLHQSKAGEVVKVVDFGIAKLLDSSTGEEDTHLTATGAVIGTPSYMAPERLGTESYGVSSDVYSAGVLMYEMVTGELPFGGGAGNYLRAAMLQATGDVTPPRAKRPDVPPALDAIIMRALASNPADRPTAAEMADTIAKAFNLAAAVPLTVTSPARVAVRRLDSTEAPTLADTEGPTETWSALPTEEA